MPPLDKEFDVAFANEIARLEIFNKHHYRPNSYLHKWWARRCGSTFRLILKHLVDDPAARDYYAAGGLAGKIILDPMMGGGTTLHEAIRLGANVVGVDLDPIPVLQVRAALAAQPLVELQQAFTQFHASLRAGLDRYFETCCPHCSQTTQLRYLLYGQRRRCTCGFALFVDSFVLRQEPDGAVIRLSPDGSAIVHIDASGCVKLLHEEKRSHQPIYDKGVRLCPTCSERFQELGNLPYYTRYQPLAVVGHCREHGRFFKLPDAGDRKRLAAADQARAGVGFAANDFVVGSGRKSRQLLLKGIDNYLDLFSSRQLLYLERAVNLLQNLAPPLRLNLALLVSTSLEFNSMLCGYKGAAKRRSGAIRHTFSHHAYSPPTTALENNPLFRRRASGTLHKLFQSRIRNGRLWAQKPRERKIPGKTAEFVEIAGEVDAGIEMTDVGSLRNGERRFLLMQSSATALNLPDGSVDYVVTDPPYFDSVQYSDLATFFRVWLRYLLPDAADWTYDVTESAVDPHKNDRESKYAELMTGIFKECRRVLKRTGRLVFTFHHWNPKGWAALTLALQQANFMMVNRYVVQAESPVSVHINKMKALLHDAILVLAPAATGIEKTWIRPSRIDDSDSAAFTYDCATLLGWMLAQRLSYADIQQVWQEAIS